MQVADGVVSMIAKKYFIAHIVVTWSAVLEGGTFVNVFTEVRWWTWPAWSREVFFRRPAYPTARTSRTCAS